MICQHVWQRDFDRLRERAWDYKCHFVMDDVECWFLIDHHGPEPSPKLDLSPSLDSNLPLNSGTSLDLTPSLGPSPTPDPPVVWYSWTGTELSVWF